MSIDIRLKKHDRVYHPEEQLTGFIVVNCKSGLSHQGISLSVEGSVSLQLSAKSVGLFEAFYNNLKPVHLINYSVDVLQAGKLPGGETEIPFELPLQPIEGQSLHETYHGVFISVEYKLKVDMTRGALSKNLSKTVEFIVEEVDQHRKIKEVPVPFTITPDSLENVKKNSVNHIPPFRVSGQLKSAVCSVRRPLVGELVVEFSEAVIKSIELQLVRVETCSCADGYAREATEIQNIQVAEGDVCRKLVLPLYMVFPRLFTCPTLTTKTFKVEFEVNLVILLEDGHLITENFPVKLLRT
eukprot:GCRY01003075.1.p1 GENE.GCRY01003075.1~~GCRY01003075.1.p1  ORF type:complete len:298 (+),score=53.86 GCRY01003075.1:197-1090(+)